VYTQLNSGISTHRGWPLGAITGSLAGVLLLTACAATSSQRIAAQPGTQLANIDSEQASTKRHASMAASEAQKRLSYAGADVTAPGTAVAPLPQARHLHARVTDRGLVMTLDDVLFESASANLNVSATGSLDELADFLVANPERTVLLEGHTDGIGSDEGNFRLSRHRAEAVRSYLMERGIGSARLETASVGKSDPVADNDTAAGRRENRSVAVIIDEASSSTSP